MKTKILKFSDLTLNFADINILLGYGAATPTPQIQAIMDEVLSHIEKILHPRYSYEVALAGEKGSTFIHFGDAKFVCGKTIAHPMRDAEKFALLVATAGEEFQQYCDQLDEEGDIVKRFVCDSIGSELAEATVREAMKDIAQSYSDLSISNPYSPGYCGWGLKEQRQIFSIIPSEISTVTINEACLMHPIKSVSALVAIGGSVEKEAYGCQICTMKSCYKKQGKQADNI